ncbi:alpha/beta fold hydrolase [Plantactinospora sp. S1510]|uniref:Alpha/beta fold hydrolase n=1 Tax=Plantactinospora alkalitolerans TaxID=2789879 RepID=A0ABS0H4G7_9ACTN|nr:alpha/beta fold hydrolase [Plantactinospora alkalitolerans]MBF9133356.1 alpha/beta fold hydrolase [Plantactinospora alkalitolerans]
MSKLDRSARRRTPWGRTVGVVSVAAAVLAVGMPVAQAQAPGRHGAEVATGWSGIVREPVSIRMEKNWTSKGELTYPRGADRRLPLVVLLHGSGDNDMDQTLPDGAGAIFKPVAQAINREGYAVLRFNKRGVTDVGPVLTDDVAQLNPPEPYEQILRDAASVVRFAATLPRVDPSRIFLLGHSEGTQVASNLAARPAATGIPEPAGVIAMGVVGSNIRELITYQLFGVRLAQLHEEFDVNGDGQLTARESVDGLVGQPAELVPYYRKVLFSGATLNPATDRNRDGRLAIDAEVGPVLRAESGIDNYPNAKDIPPDISAYLVDIDRFNDVTEDLPRFDGPTLLLNGENDVQTPARSALVADAAIARAGRTDHTVITYPGVGHAMNTTSKFTGPYGEPDAAVLADIRRWLADHR